VPQPPPDTAASVLALDCLGCLLQRGLPLVSLLEASLVRKEPSPRGADEQALEPFALGAFVARPCRESDRQGLVFVKQTDGATSSYLLGSGSLMGS
jgi:hypothetical protein